MRSVSVNIIHIIKSDKKADHIENRQTYKLFSEPNLYKIM